jgi:hypothetical protein
MEYKIIIQENERNGAIYIRTLPLDPSFVQEAMRVREACGNSYCVFVLEYCQN